MDKQVVAVCDQIRAIDKSHLKKQIGNLPYMDQEALDEGLWKALVLA